MRRNSRNHPFAFRVQRGSGGMAAKSLTIGIVILERSRMGFSMDVPQPRYPQDGWGRRFRDKRLWYLIAGTRGGIRSTSRTSSKSGDASSRGWGKSRYGLDPRLTVILWPSVHFG